MSKFKIGLFLNAITLPLTSQFLMSFEEAQPVPVNQQVQQAVEKPRNGQSMEQVESQYGVPAERTSPVGEPPITKWQYTSFTVYFEHNKVIHSVLHRT